MYAPPAEETGLVTAARLLHTAAAIEQGDRGLLPLWGELHQTLDRVCVRGRRSPELRRPYESDGNAIVDVCFRLIWFTLSTLRRTGVVLASKDTPREFIPWSIINNNLLIDGRGNHVFPEALLATIDATVTPVPETRPPHTAAAPPVPSP